MKGLFMALLCFPWTAFGQADTVHRTRRLRITPLPVIYYSPETRFGFGALVAGNFETAHDAVTRSSYGQTYFLYTVNKQYEWGNKLRLYGPQNSYIVYGRFNFTYFPEYYYGIETEDPESRKDTIEYNQSSLDLQVSWKVHQSLYIGLPTRYNKISDVSAPVGGHFYEDNPTGYTGYWLLGFAPMLTIETRDNFVYPRQGFFLEIMAQAYPKWNHESYPMYGVKIDARKYLPVEWISDLDVIAFQFIANAYGGQVPFKDMADIGGAFTMRGYYKGFFRYQNLYAFQVEYRAKVFWRLGFTIWAGAALTPVKWYSFFDHPVKPNAGIGLRLMLNKTDRLNVRFDQGFGKLGQRGSYLDIAEAF